MLQTAEDFTSILLRRKLLTPTQLRGAESLRRQTSGRLHDVLIEFGYISAEQVRSVLAELRHSDHSSQLPEWVDLTGISIPTEIVALVPESVARQYLAMPLGIIDGLLYVAMPAPDDRESLARLEFILDRPIRPAGAAREQIIDCIDRHYRQPIDEKGPVRPRKEQPRRMMLARQVLQEINASGRQWNKQTQLAMDDAAREARDFGGWDLRTPSATVATAGAPQIDMSDSADFCLALEEEEETPAPPAAMPSVLTRRAGRGAYGQGLHYAVRVERQATIRYYSQMSPERMFPLLVVISEQAIGEVVQKHVAQKQSEKFQVELGSDVEVEPILPGCECFPPKETIKIEQKQSTAQFWVVPRVLGEVMGARVVIRQNGTVLAVVPLQIRVVKQTATMCVGAMNFCVPFVSMLLKQSELSLTSSDGGSGLLAALVGWLLVMLSPEVMAALLLAATIGLYLWLRPRQRDLFWDIEPQTGPTRTGD
jgi:hypothetical protein